MVYNQGAGVAPGDPCGSGLRTFTARPYPPPVKEAHMPSGVYDRTHLIKSLAERFWSKVRKGPGCWEWTGTKSSGYGYIIRGATGTKSERAHRVSWELHMGSSPGALHVCHKCDNPGCVNPDHLFLGTMSENILDAYNKGRKVKGENHPWARLGLADVLKIREAVSNGDSQRNIAKAMGVTQTTISMIARRETWRTA